jgi:hypothetical protein
MAFYPAMFFLQETNKVSDFRVEENKEQSSEIIRKHTVFRCKRRSISQGRLKESVQNGYSLISCINDEVDDGCRGFAMRASRADESGRRRFKVSA